MFTGIIRHIGTITHVRRVSSGTRLSVSVDDLGQDLSCGRSVCVEGVCLTVTAINGKAIDFDVIPETLRRSTLGALQQGQRVNMEPSLRVGDSLDGHFLQGHVDGTAVLERHDTQRGEHILWFEPEPAVLPYLIPKGAVAVDGVSLTIADVVDGTFSVALIPTTLELTTLGRLGIGDRVNIESDIISRTVVHHIESMNRQGGLTIDQLRSQGYA
ncbi:MAG: riboflavin synthase [Phycisphaerae bacterium]